VPQRESRWKINQMIELQSERVKTPDIFTFCCHFASHEEQPELGFDHRGGSFFGTIDTEARGTQSECEDFFH
jgi:hypothetical protein